MFITKEVCFWALKQDLKKTSELVKEIEIFENQFSLLKNFNDRQNFLR